MFFVKGQIVELTVFGFKGKTETFLREVHSIRNGAIYLKDEQGNIDHSTKFSATSGEELEKFFLPMYSQIKPYNERRKKSPGFASVSKDSESSDSSTIIPESLLSSKKARH